MSKIVFWDWTGTLADEARLDKAVCRSMEEDIAANKKIPREEAERLFNDHLKGIENSWQWHDYVQHGRDFSIDWRRSQVANLNKLHLVPYAREILDYTKGKGYLNILVTNAVRDVVLLRAKHVGIRDRFDAVFASNDVKALKEEGKHFECGLYQFDGDPSRSYSVGDNPIQDIKSAKKLGLKTIFCDFEERLVHYHSAHISDNHWEVCDADYTIKSLQEIEKII